MKEHKNTSNTELPTLINQLKTKDLNYAAISKRMQIVYWALCLLYLVIIIIEITEKSPLRDIMSLSCFLGGMISLALLFRKFQKEYGEVDYSQPTLLMLKKAVNRYQPFAMRTIWILPGILLIDIGLTLRAPEFMDILLTQLFFLGAILLGLVGGLIWWYIQYKPLRDHAQRLIDDIESA